MLWGRGCVVCGAGRRVQASCELWVRGWLPAASAARVHGEPGTGTLSQSWGREPMEEEPALFLPKGRLHNPSPGEARRVRVHSAFGSGRAAFCSVPPAAARRCASPEPFGVQLPGAEGGGSEAVFPCRRPSSSSSFLLLGAAGVPAPRRSAPPFPHRPRRCRPTSGQHWMTKTPWTPSVKAMGTPTASRWGLRASAGEGGRGKGENSGPGKQQRVAGDGLFSPGWALSLGAKSGVGRAVLAAGHCPLLLSPLAAIGAVSRGTGAVPTVPTTQSKWW